MLAENDVNTESLNFEQKINYGLSCPFVVGFVEGMFVRFYNESLFIWNQWAEKQGRAKLKVLVRSNKKTHTITRYGGFPISALEPVHIDFMQSGKVLQFTSLNIYYCVHEYNVWQQQHADVSVDNIAKSNHNTPPNNTLNQRITVETHLIQEIADLDVLNTPPSHWYLIQQKIKLALANN
ncbi:TPA: hypothetical protein ACX3FR_004170 [Vibrio parahaemolyticus]